MTSTLFDILPVLNDYFCEVGHNLPVRDFECFSDFEPATLPEINDKLFRFDDLSSGCM